MGWDTITNLAEKLGMVMGIPQAFLTMRMPGQPDIALDAEGNLTPTTGLAGLSKSSVNAIAGLRIDRLIIDDPEGEPF